MIGAADAAWCEMSGLQEQVIPSGQVQPQSAGEGGDHLFRGLRPRAALEAGLVVAGDDLPTVFHHRGGWWFSN